MPFSPNMNLPLSVVGATSAPDWALNLNTSLSIVDAHDHTPGNGVQLTPGSLDINTDLTIQGHNLLSVKSVRFTAQGSPLAGATDLDCAYVSGVDLYYNDGNGNRIRITQSGAVAGSPGSISNLVSPASASYDNISETFIWQSDINTAAGMDNGPITIREIAANAHGITINSPTALSASYNLTLMGALPASNKIMRVDNSGNVSSTLGVDGSTIDITSNNLEVMDGGITSAKIASGAIVDANVNSAAAIVHTKLANMNTALSSGTGSLTAISGSSLSPVSGLSASFTTTGGLVIGLLISYADFGGSSQIGSIEISNGTPAGSSIGSITLKRGSTYVSSAPTIALNMAVGTTNYFRLPPSSVIFYDAPSAGTYAYTVEAAAASAGSTTGFRYCKLLLIELK